MLRCVGAACLILALQKRRINAACQEKEHLMLIEFFETSLCERPKPAAASGIGIERALWAMKRDEDRNCKGALARPLLFPERNRLAERRESQGAPCGATMRVPRDGGPSEGWWKE